MAKPMAKFYFINEKDYGNNTAAVKVRSDLIQIFKKNGGKALNKIPLLNNSKNKKFFLYYFFNIIASVILSLKLSLVKDRKIIIVYPIVKKNLLLKSIKKCIVRNETHLFAIDINYFFDRYRGLNENAKPENDTFFFNLFKSVIVFNEKTKEFLINHGLTVPCVGVGIFDYLSQESNTTLRKLSANLCFVGYLKKASFLYKIPSEYGLKINVYGDCYDKVNENQSISYCGSINPDEIKNVKDDSAFGLVWDGHEISSIDDYLGGYLKISVPHKASCYLMMGLPLIASEDSGISDFILKERVGFVVKSLSAVKAKINLITEQEYNEMQQNVFNLQKKIMNGVFVRNALSKIFEEINDD